MTSSEIERRAEAMIDKGDKLFLAGVLSQSAYDKYMQDVADWCDEQYKNVERALWEV